MPSLVAQMVVLLKDTSLGYIVAYGELLRAARDRLAAVEPWEASAIDEALRALADELGQKPRQAFAPIRMAVTGSKISPGLFESLELLGREESLRRLNRAVAVA